MSAPNNVAFLELKMTCMTTCIHLTQIISVFSQIKYDNQKSLSFFLIIEVSVF